MLALDLRKDKHCDRVHCFRNHTQVDIFRVNTGPTRLPKTLVKTIPDADPGREADAEPGRPALVIYTSVLSNYMDDSTVPLSLTFPFRTCFTSVTVMCMYVIVQYLHTVS